MKLLRLIAFISIFSFFLLKPASAVTPLDGKLIALDAGHGGTEIGAANSSTGVIVMEKDVNLATTYATKLKLEAGGATVVLVRENDENIDSRRQRVEIAKSKCNAIAGRDCDILVSIHHNGSIDPAHDGTLVIYNERQDKPLAQALHDSLVTLTGIDEGYLWGGYGMTVFGHMVSALTEGYYASNDNEANLYLQGTPFTTSGGYIVLIGERVNTEAQLQLEGITNYFINKKTGKGKP